MSSVLQEWVERLSFMQQSVLVAGVRGPDTVAKDHPAKVLMRWYRRCVLYSAFESKVLGKPVVLATPEVPGGGSFTGPVSHLDAIIISYLRNVDEIPHHFHLHLVHGAEIIGYKHSDPVVRASWQRFYEMAVRDMHLTPETEAEMDVRLGDSEQAWRAHEVVTAR